jgi:hypothetical protein
MNRIGRWSIWLLFVTATFPTCAPLAHAPQTGRIVTDRSSSLQIVNNSEWPIRVYSMPSNALLGHVGAFSEDCVGMPFGTERLRADPFASNAMVMSPEIMERASGWRWIINKIENDLAIDFVPTTPCDHS